MKKQKIGILGGMGPEASYMLYRLIIETAQECFGATTNKRAPYIHLVNIPVPELIQSTQSQETTISMVKKAKEDCNNIGITTFALPCNTMHLFKNNIFDQNDHFLSMIETVVSKIKADKISTVGILGSRTTIHQNLYQKELKTNGIKSITLDPVQQLETNTIILDTIAGKNKSELQNLLQRQITILKQKGADAIILGCTELPLLIEPTQSTTKIYSSLHLLAHKICETFYNDYKETSWS